ncbi:hypothetical protein A5844_000646 [Enterococcus sp. 10A9_DIV0425]|uniref:Uncharacterized protein n=1 Tax=Candidatus Enterococcus wittei TaxID=1987383 RepID=A0A2C9XQE0_9ENTE|nr:hypothetical protein [Enterococcus sp. 10A9_DIV0425]OTP12413.1 hypothetical protein A5844_000646 [Enterococcus sp. 10A9_DIV0425]THE07493.1 hypothetical protein E1H99_12375 [Enterococcus hirae]
MNRFFAWLGKDNPTQGPESYIYKQVKSRIPPTKERKSPQFKRRNAIRLDKSKKEEVVLKAKLPTLTYLSWLVIVPNTFEKIIQRVNHYQFKTKTFKLIDLTQNNFQLKRQDGMILKGSKQEQSAKNFNRYQKLEVPYQQRAKMSSLKHKVVKAKMKHQLQQANSNQTLVKNDVHHSIFSHESRI